MACIHSSVFPGAVLLTVLHPISHSGPWGSCALHAGFWLNCSK